MTSSHTHRGLAATLHALVSYLRPEMRFQPHKPFNLLISIVTCKANSGLLALKVFPIHKPLYHAKLKKLGFPAVNQHFPPWKS